MADNDFKRKYTWKQKLQIVWYSCFIVGGLVLLVLAILACTCTKANAGEAEDVCIAALMEGNFWSGLGVDYEGTAQSNGMYKGRGYTITLQRAKNFDEVESVKRQLENLRKHEADLETQLKTLEKGN